MLVSDWGQKYFDMENETINKILHLSARGEHYRVMQILTTHIHEQDKKIEALENKLRKLEGESSMTKPFNY